MKKSHFNCKLLDQDLKSPILINILQMLFTYIYESNINYIMKMFETHNFDAKKYEVIKKYKSDTLYFAFNINTDDKIIQQLQKSLDQLKKDGTYQKIKSKYLKYK